MEARGGSINAEKDAELESIGRSGFKKEAKEKNQLRTMKEKKSGSIRHFILLCAMAFDDPQLVQRHPAVYNSKICVFSIKRIKCGVLAFSFL